MPYLLNGEPLPEGQAFSVGDHQYPPNALSVMPRAELLAIPGVSWVEPEPVIVTLDELRDRRNGAVNEKREAVFEIGFLVPSGPLAGSHLQMRSADDKANWLVAETEARDAVTMGAGDLPIAQIRTLENQTITLTPSQVLAVLAQLKAWARRVMTRSWTLKDQNDAAVSAEDLVSHEELEKGWS